MIKMMMMMVMMMMMIMMIIYDDDDDYYYNGGGQNKEALLLGLNWPFFDHFPKILPNCCISQDDYGREEEYEYGDYKDEYDDKEASGNENNNEL